MTEASQYLWVCTLAAAVLAYPHMELNAEIYAFPFTGNNDVLATKCSRSWVSLPGVSGP